MRKLFFYILLLAGIGFAYSQNPEIKTELPTVIPPSPTVANLMKFEEVPVSNYTGVPDISIPLISLPTHSKDINLDVSLKYHSGVNAKDVASDVGLGWSLFAGGTISRTVRGLPDEELIIETGQGNVGKVGMYHTSYNNHINSYYYFTENIFNEDEYSFYDNYSLSPTNKEKINEFIWSTNQKNRYDTEHDLWQFNFMGHSGRFYIKKNTSDNMLEVIPLDDYRLKINYSCTTVGINNYVPESFTIYDEKGYKYIFNVAEKSKSFSAYENFIYGQTVSQQGTSSEREHISALHLSTVHDPNGNLLISFNYTDDNQINECRKDFVLTSNEPYGLNSLLFEYYASYYPCMNEFPPYKTHSNNFELIKVRKLTTINVTDYGIITFDYGLGRQDTNIQISGAAPFLNSISLKDLSQNVIKEFEFDYFYSNVLSNRMMLKSILKNNSEKYDFFYDENDSSGYSIGEDYWGFLNLDLPCRISSKFRKETTPSFSTTDLLQKIKYPTGGCVIFDFEPNTYSYIGEEPLTNFDDNPDNYTLTSSQTLIFNNLQQSYSTDNSNNNAPLQLLEFSPTEKLKVRITSGISYPMDITEANRGFKLMKLINGQWSFTGENLTCPYDSNNCCFDLTLEAGVQYGILRELYLHPYNGPNGDIISIDYFTKNPNQLEFLYGGGNRIKQIGYFDNNVPKDYFSLTELNQSPSKLKQYSYNFFDNIYKSSGALVYSKPVFVTESDFWINTTCAIFQQSASIQFGYRHYSNKNLLIPVKTQGSDVGYKNVTVSEINNGKTQYVFSSPIDYPEQISVFLKPHIPSKNIDYKRGLLLNEKNYNNERILNEVQYSYTFDDYEQQSGIKIFRYKDDPFFQGNYFNSYNAMKALYDIGDGIWATQSGSDAPGFYISSPILFHCGNPHSQRNFYIRPIKEAYGWAKLTSKTTTNFFYDSSATERTVQTTETFSYNPENKMISESTSTTSLGEMLKTKYFYHSGNSIYSQNRIAAIDHIETYRGLELLSYSKVEYANNWGNNVSYLPSFISSAKGSSAVEQRIRFTKYDAYGNTLEVQQVDGSPISYIWGYHNTQPVAKIENMAYDAIPPYLITAIQSATDTGTESSVVTALNNLRNNAALANSMVTTLTYIPLVGVSTVTDPKGDTITYTYDSFGRLQFVKDKDNNPLSENQYNYKP